MAKLKVMPMLHPSFIMRQQDYIPVTISDMQKGLNVPPEHYVLQPTLEELRAYCNANVLCFDIETNRFTNAITMVGLSTQPTHVLVVPFRGAYIDVIKHVFETAKAVVGQNIIQFDLPRLKENGVNISPDCQVWDIMLIYHLLHPDSPANDLEFIGSIYTQKPAWKHLQSEDMALYCARDVDVTMQAYKELAPLLRRLNLVDLYKYTQVPLGMICHAMTTVGLKTDSERVKYAIDKLHKEAEELSAKLPESLKPYIQMVKKRKPAPTGTLGKGGKPVKFIHVEQPEEVTPWSSPKKVEKFLYETLGLPKQLHPKTKRVTTDKNALERLSKRYKLPELIVLKQLRTNEEMQSTFFKEKVVGAGRVHGNYLVHGTNTGRLSSSGPNLQNLNATAKYIYVPSHSDWCFAEADFSSLENRLAAYYANDTDRLHRMSIPGFNEHRWLASQIFNIPEAEVDKASEEYGKAKHTNHGADAGMGPRKMSMQYGIPEKDCRECLLMWRKLNAASVRWQEAVGNEATREGVLTTAFGRKKWFWTASAYTEGIRFMVQSTGADICFRAMIGLMYEQIGWKLEDALKVCPIVAPLPFPARLVAQVHDSLLIEFPLALREKVTECLQKVMTQPWQELGGYNIPIEIKVGEPGDSWAELRAI